MFLANQHSLKETLALFRSIVFVDLEMNATRQLNYTYVTCCVNRFFFPFSQENILLQILFRIHAANHDC